MTIIHSVKENKALKWPGKGSIDELEYLNGLKYRRDFHRMG